MLQCSYLSIIYTYVVLSKCVSYAYLAVVIRVEKKTIHEGGNNNNNNNVFKNFYPMERI